MQVQTRILLAVSGLSQQQLASRAGISAGTVSRFLRGERTLSRRSQRRLVEVLTDEIVGGRVPSANDLSMTPEGHGRAPP